MSLTSLTQETMEIKKNHASSTYKAWDKIGHLLGHVTLTYKVTRQGHVSGLHAIDFLTQETMETKTIHVFSMYRVLRKDRSLVRSRDLDMQGHASKQRTWFTCHWLPWSNKPQKHKSFLLLSLFTVPHRTVKNVWPWFLRSLQKVAWYFETIYVISNIELKSLKNWH